MREVANLSELDPYWQQCSRLDDDIDINNAQGILFLCPACFEKNKGAIGTHCVLCWFKDRNVPSDEDPGPGRWTVSGSDFNDVTLVASVQLKGGCGWHGYIRDGKALVL